VIVLDASAVIALYGREAGWDQILNEIGSGAISTVNLAEVLTMFANQNGKPERVGDDIRDSGCEIAPVTAAHALAAAELRPVTRSASLSLGDRLSLALAIERQCPVMTADKCWTSVDVGVPIVLLR
jgi:ribonuclease VapC